MAKLSNYQVGVHAAVEAVGIDEGETIRGNCFARGTSDIIAS